MPVATPISSRGFFLVNKKHCGRGVSTMGGLLVILRNKTHSAKQQNEPEIQQCSVTTQEWEDSSVMFNGTSNPCTQKCACTHTNVQTHNQSCKIQLYLVTWDHLQEMKSITKESRKVRKYREKIAKGAYFHTCDCRGKKKFSLTYKQERETDSFTEWFTGGGRYPWIKCIDCIITKKAL